MNPNNRNAARVLLILLPIALAACGATRSVIESVEDQPVGTAVGAGVGALAGALLTDSGFGALIGAALGGYAGQQVAEAWDESDRNQIQRAMTSNETVSWTDPQTNLAYTVRPGEAVDRSGPGAPCRRFTMQVNPPADTNLRGVACREGDTWRVYDLASAP
jgi:hypothetical protein